MRSSRLSGRKAAALVKKSKVVAKGLPGDTQRLYTGAPLRGSPLSELPGKRHWLEVTGSGKEGKGSRVSYLWRGATAQHEVGEERLGDTLGCSALGI